MGTGSRLLGESQGASRKRCVDERTSRIAGKAPPQALFRHPIATVESSMVRRGSTVRVRQRALRSPCKSALFLAAPLAELPACARSCRLWEPSGSERTLQCVGKWMRSPECLSEYALASQAEAKRHRLHQSLGPDRGRVPEAECEAGCAQARRDCAECRPDRTRHQH